MDNFDIVEFKSYADLKRHMNKIDSSISIQKIKKKHIFYSNTNYIHVKLKSYIEYDYYTILKTKIQKNHIKFDEFIISDEYIYIHSGVYKASTDYDIYVINMPLNIFSDSGCGVLRACIYHYPELFNHSLMPYSGVSSDYYEYMHFNIRKDLYGFFNRICLYPCLQNNTTVLQILFETGLQTAIIDSLKQCIHKSVNHYPDDSDTDILSSISFYFSTKFNAIIKQHLNRKDAVEIEEIIDVTLFKIIKKHIDIYEVFPHITQLHSIMRNKKSAKSKIRNVIINSHRIQKLLNEYVYTDIKDAKSYYSLMNKSNKKEFQSYIDISYIGIFN